MIERFPNWKGIVLSVSVTSGAVIWLLLNPPQSSNLKWISDFLPKIILKRSLSISGKLGQNLANVDQQPFGK